MHSFLYDLHWDFFHLTVQLKFYNNPDTGYLFVVHSISQEEEMTTGSERVELKHRDGVNATGVGRYPTGGQDCCVWKRESHRLLVIKITTLRNTTKTQGAGSK